MFVLSRLHPKKNLDVLIEAFLSLVQSPQFADWRLVLAGDGPTDYVSMLKSESRASSYKDRITFTGWLEGDEKNAVLGGAVVAGPAVAPGELRFVCDGSVVAVGAGVGESECESRRRDRSSECRLDRVDR